MRRRSSNGDVRDFGISGHAQPICRTTAVELAVSSTISSYTGRDGEGDVLNTLAS